MIYLSTKNPAVLSGRIFCLLQGGLFPEFFQHGLCDGCRGSGTSESGAYFSIFGQHCRASFRVFDKIADFLHQCVRVAVVLDEFLEGKTVDYEVAEAYVLDLHYPFGYEVGERIADVSYYLRGVEKYGFQ